MVVVYCCLSVVGRRVLSAYCRVSLEVVVFGSRLSGVGCRMLCSGVECRVLFVGCWLPGVGFRVLFVGCWLSGVDFRCQFSGAGCRVLVVRC
jgi:hypothetical protein